MALAIKSIPVLIGKDAERFVMEADKNSQAIRKKMPKERAYELKQFLAKSRNFSM